MNAMELVKAMSVLLPIVGLVVVGFAITLQSGVTNPISHQGLRQVGLEPLAGRFAPDGMDG